MFAPTRTAADAAAAAPDESRRRLLALSETMDACARRRGARPSQILAAATPKRAAHTPACVPHSTTNATNKSHRREVQSFDSRRHHSPLTTDEQ